MKRPRVGYETRLVLLALAAGAPAVAAALIILWFGDYE